LSQDISSWISQGSSRVSGVVQGPSTIITQYHRLTDSLHHWEGQQSSTSGNNFSMNRMVAENLSNKLFLFDQSINKSIKLVIGCPLSSQMISNLIKTGAGSKA
jgi:hypothetical protein